MPTRFIAVDALSQPQDFLDAQIRPQPVFDLVACEMRISIGIKQALLSAQAGAL